MFRVGTGYDIHRLEEGLPLIMGGVEIPYELGLKGHSDADVLVHAIMDAMLGALSLPDIGTLFPDNDSRYKNIPSLKLLGTVKEKMENETFQIVNIDSVIIAQKPKLSPYISAMKKNIAGVLNVDENTVGIKATTNEGLDSTGKNKGIAAQAVVLLGKHV